MKRVVLIRSNAVRNDPAVEKVANALMEAGCKITILAWDRDGKYDGRAELLPLPQGTAEVIRFGIPAIFGGGIKKNLQSMIKFQSCVKLWLSNNCDRYDVIHAFDLDTGLVAKNSAKKYKKKLCYHILDFYAASRFREGSLPYRVIAKIEHAVINHANATIVCTEARKRQIKGSRPKNLTVIHNTPGYIAPNEIEKLDLQSDRMKIAYVGCFETIRYIKELIECVAEDERFELHIGGFGVLEDYVRKSAEACERIIFYGKIPYTKVLGLEKACDVMTALYAPHIANHKYAAPNKVYEAMMLSKPVIMCKNTGWDETVEKYGTGILVDPGKDGLKDGLNALYDKKEYWQVMGNNAERLYREKYSWSIVKDRIIKLYENL